ncbi:MAG: DNA polymerase III subunit beta [Chthoniobacter sp.]|nr:DNA polymerase III subunit beta [Chthoniobacter sp.]
MSPIALPIAELKPALTGLAKVINRHSALPVLNTIRIERTPDNWVALTATDLDTFVVVRLEQPVPGDPGALLVPYDELLKTLKGRGKDEVLFVEPGDNHTAVIRYAIGDQFAETRVESLPVEEYPPLPNISGAPIPVDAALRSAIQQALQCASTDETRLILNGAYLDVSKPKAHYVVGTDGRHLFSSNSFVLPLKESLLIPSHRFLGWKEFSADGEWQLRVGEKNKDNAPPFQLSSRRWQFISRQIEGNYPNWRQVVPDGRGTQTTIEVDPEAVEAIQQTITRMPDHDFVNHGLGLEVIGHQVRLLGKSSPDDAWTRVTLDGVKIHGKEVTTFLNRELLAKALRFGLTRIDVIDAMSPVRFSEGGRQMIVMPVRASPAPTKPTPPPASGPVAPQANPTPKAEQPETTMPEQNGHTNGATRSTPTAAPAEKPALETALAQIEIVRGDFRNAIAGLNKLGDALKQAQREQKAGDKEVQSVRQTLRSLQSVRI